MNVCEFASERTSRGSAGTEASDRVWGVKGERGRGGRGRECEPEAGNAARWQPLPTTQRDGGAEGERGDDSDARGRERLGFDAGDLHAAFALALLNVRRGLPGVAFATGLAT